MSKPSKMILLGVCVGVTLLAVTLVNHQPQPRVDTGPAAGPINQGDSGRKPPTLTPSPRSRPIPRLAGAAPNLSAEYRIALERAVDAKSAWSSGEVRWSPTVLQLEDPAFTAEKRLECGRKHGGGIKEACDYQIDLVVERLGPDKGRVVHAESRVTGDVPEEGCPDFAACVAQARSGESLPLPPGDEPLVGVSQKLQSTPLPDFMKDREHLKKLVAHFRGTNERMRAQVEQGDPRVAHEVASRENIARYIERKLEPTGTDVR